MRDCQYKGPAIHWRDGAVTFPCALIMNEAGHRGLSIVASKCDACSEVDDGSSFVSERIRLALHERIAENWAKSPLPLGCETCSGSTIPLTEAIGRMKARASAGVAFEILAEAVSEHGMPESEMLALAAAYLPELVNRRG